MPLSRKLEYMGRWTASACLCLLVALCNSCSSEADVYSISIPALKLSANESISSLEISILAGQVQAVSHIPVAWNVKIENNVDWHCLITASTAIGAATMMPDEVGRMVFSVRKNEYDGRKFNVTGSLTLGQNSGGLRRMPLKMTDFSLSGIE